MAELKSEPCPDCKAITIVVLAEPEGKPMRFDPTPRRMWQLVEVSPSHAAAVPREVHESHVTTCKAINRTE